MLLTMFLIGMSMGRPTTVEDSDYDSSNYDSYQQDDASGDGDPPGEENIEQVSLDKPDFVSQGGTHTVRPGDVATLTCQVNDLGGNQLIWTKTPGLKGAEDILFVGSHQAANHWPALSLTNIENNQINQGSSLVITGATMEDEGTYTCKIASADDQKLEFTVSVSNEPSPVVDPKGGGNSVSASLVLLISAAFLVIL